MNIANALHVTVDDLLCDSLEESKDVFHREFLELVSDCSHSELQIITGTVRALKESLRKGKGDIELLQK